MNKWVNVDTINSTIGKALEESKTDLSPSFYNGARTVLDQINKMVKEANHQKISLESEVL